MNEVSIKPAWTKDVTAGASRSEFGKGCSDILGERLLNHTQMETKEPTPEPPNFPAHNVLML